jgi:hypothetical protein
VVSTDLEKVFGEPEVNRDPPTQNHFSKDILSFLPEGDRLNAGREDRVGDGLRRGREGLLRRHARAGLHRLRHRGGSHLRPSGEDSIKRNILKVLQLTL